MLSHDDRSDELQRRLDALAELGSERALVELWQLQAQFSAHLPLYVLLCQHHAARGEWHFAERAARAGFVHAAQQSGLPAELSLETLRTRPDFNCEGPARVWLFMLSALALVRGRLGDQRSATSLRAWAQRCDPHGSLGSDVVSLLVACAA